MRDLLKKLLSRRSSTSASHHVVVGIGTETFGVPADQIHETICLGDLEEMPRLPKRFTGLVRIIGKLIYLQKLQAPLTRTQAEVEVDPRACILVLKAHSAISSNIPKGIVVDRVERLIELEEGDIEAVATRRKGLWSDCRLGFGRRHLPVVLLDLERLAAPEATPSGIDPSANVETATSRLKRRLPK